MASIKQYEPPKVPSSWRSADEKRFVVSLIDILDDIYSRYGRLSEKDLSKALRNRLEGIDGSFSEINQTVDSIELSVTGLNENVDKLNFRVVVTPSKTILSSDADEITLTATVFSGDSDITADLGADSFTWIRLSGDTASDETWNAENHTGKTLTIGASAVERYATYTCTVETA